MSLPGPGDIYLGPEWCLGGACPHDHPSCDHDDDETCEVCE